MLQEILSALTRRKLIDQSTVGESKLARVLTVFDLTALGVGATLGAGVYVLTGAVAKETSGPSVVIAFLIAALTSILSGLCYAEFGARVPKAGSGYVYSYVTVGELSAFVIGWNLVLSYVIGAASVARAWTANFDAMVGGKIESAMRDCCTMSVPGLAEYPDIFAFVIIMLLAALIAFGVKEFATVNKVFTVLNVCVIIFVVIAGYIHADTHNWALSQEEIVNISLSYNMTNVTLTTYGTGGFMPYGFSGLISGTATCFYAFVGFDCIATTGEEAVNPQRSIPLGIVYSLLICCIAYLGISSALTLMQPYFLLDTDAPLPYAFAYVGMNWAVYPVSIGAICALSTSLLGAMFPMPRIIYAMAIDGLLFKKLSHVSEKTKTPVVATAISGFFAGIMAVFFDLKELVDLMSIGTLAAYTLVATSVLLLRYQPDKEADLDSVVALQMEASDDKTKLNSNPQFAKDSFQMSRLLRPKYNKPTKLSSAIVNWCVLIAAIAIIIFSVIAEVTAHFGWSAAGIAFAMISFSVILLSVLVIVFQPQSRKKLAFSVPLVPYIPVANMFVNIYLMVSLPPSTWYKLLIWMILGFSIYFFYGVWHSTEREENKPKEDKSEKHETEKMLDNKQDQLLLNDSDK